MVVVTCEHGGNRVPPNLARAFARWRGMLQTHRGWDPGALELAEQLAANLGAPLHASMVSRLVVDLNRSESHPRVFSEITRSLPAEIRQELLETHYRPFRNEVEQSIARATRRNRRVLHVSVHSFTPVLAGRRRNADIGLLYDPSLPWERELVQAWRREMLAAGSGLRVRLNYPYKGTSDGHTTRLRTRFPAGVYAGIELEVNQSIVRAGGRRWTATRAEIVRSLAAVMAKTGLRQAEF